MTAIPEPTPPRGSLFARAFASIGPRMDGRGAAEHRRTLVAEATGVVVEIGAGYGATFEHYGDRVTRVLALEPDAHLRAAATATASRVPLDIDVRAGVVESIPLADGTVDTVVSSLVLCSVRDQAAALAEIARVLAPGGRLLVYEHVRSNNGALALAEDAMTPLWGLMAGGCHPNRDTVAAVREAGFTVDSERRFGFAVLPGVPPVAHVLVAATRPAQPAPAGPTSAAPASAPPEQ